MVLETNEQGSMFLSHNDVFLVIKSKIFNLLKNRHTCFVFDLFVFLFFCYQTKLVTCITQQRSSAVERLKVRFSVLYVAVAQSSLI